jgi:hypothetical protein
LQVKWAGKEGSSSASPHPYPASLLGLGKVNIFHKEIIIYIGKLLFTASLLGLGKVFCLKLLALLYYVNNNFPLYKKNFLLFCLRLLM